MVFCNRFVFECFIPNIRLLLKTRNNYVVNFIVLTYFTSLNHIHILYNFQSNKFGDWNLIDWNTV